MFKVKQRYQINNQHSVNNGKFLTIVKVEGTRSTLFMMDTLQFTTLIFTVILFMI